MSDAENQARSRSPSPFRGADFDTPRAEPVVEDQGASRAEPVGEVKSTSADAGFGGPGGRPRGKPVYEEVEVCFKPMSRVTKYCSVSICSPEFGLVYLRVS